MEGWLAVFAHHDHRKFGYSAAVVRPHLVGYDVGQHARVVVEIAPNEILGLCVVAVCVIAVFGRDVYARVRAWELPHLHQLADGRTAARHFAVGHLDAVRAYRFVVDVDRLAVACVGVVAGACRE